jgi:hypothetical protein
VQRKVAITSGSTPAKSGARLRLETRARVAR